MTVSFRPIRPDEAAFLDEVYASTRLDELAHDTPAAASLYLHMGLRNPGDDVLALADTCGIRDRLWLTTSAAEKPTIPNAHLNLISPPCEVGLHTTAACYHGLWAGVTDKAAGGSAPRGDARLCPYARCGVHIQRSMA